MSALLRGRFLKHRGSEGASRASDGSIAASCDLTSIVAEQPRQLAVAIDSAEPDLSEGDETVKERQGCLLGRERRLGLRSSTEFAIQVLQRIRRTQRPPHCLGEVEESQQVVARLAKASRYSRTERAPLLIKGLEGIDRLLAVVGVDDRVVVTLQFRVGVPWAVLLQVWCFVLPPPSVGVVP